MGDRSGVADHDDDDCPHDSIEPNRLQRDFGAAEKVDRAQIISTGPVRTKSSRSSSTEPRAMRVSLSGSETHELGLQLPTVLLA